MHHLDCPHCHFLFEIAGASATELICPSCGSNVQFGEPGSTIGVDVPSGLRQVGRFTLLQVVGQGSFGTVYKARDESLDRVVALKLPRSSNLPADGPERDRFLREARSAAQLRHASIVSIHEVGEDAGRPFLVSDFVEGVTLADLLSAKKLSPRDSAKLLAEVADALHFAHECGVVHRDVKPSNIMLGKDGRPLVMDFGLAKRDAGEVTMTMEGQVLGTPSYMAPEQARGEGHLADRRADVYSLGVILYLLLTGELPFRGTARMLLNQVLNDEPRPPRKLNDHIPRDLETICLKAMAKEPARRYQTAAVMAGDLRRFLDGQPIVARPVSRVERGLRWANRNRMVAVLLGLLAIAVVSILSILTLYSVRLNRERQAAEDHAAQEALLRKEADEKGDLAEHRLRRVEQALYKNQIGQAASAVVVGDAAGAEQALDATRPDLRNWEYGYLRRKALGTLLIMRGHTGAVTCAAFSPDGSRIVTTSADQTARVWDTRTGAELLTLRGHSGPVTAAAFSPDGSRIVTASADQTARIWDSQTGAELRTLRGHTGGVSSASFSPDGTRVVTGSGDQSARLWDARSGDELLTFRGHTSAVNSAAFSPDGTRVVTASGDPSLRDQSARVWDVGTGLELLALRGHTQDVTAASFSPDGARIVTASKDQTARVWDARSGAELLRPTGHTSQLTAATFSPDGARIVTASVDRTARVWDARSGVELYVLRGHTGHLHAASFSPDGCRIVTASADQTARLWDARTGTRDLILLGHASGVSGASFSPDGSRIVTASGDMTARVWDSRTADELLSLRGHRSILTAASFSPDGSRIVTASWDRTARIWDARSGVEVLTLRGHTGELSAASFSRDGSRVLTASRDGTARIWDARSGAPILALRGHAHEVTAASFSPDGSRIVTASMDRTARVWDARSGALLTTLQGHAGWLTAASFSPDGNRVATASVDRTVRLWDARTGAEVLSLRGHTSIATAASFSPDGSRILTGGFDQTARLWDARTGDELLSLRGHTNGVAGVSFSADGTRVVTASHDQTARVWDSRTGTEPISLRGHADVVNRASFSPDGLRLVSASRDQTARIWDAGTGAELVTLRGHTEDVTAALFSADGARVITRDAKGIEHIWDASTGQLLPGQVRPDIASESSTTADGSWQAITDGDRVLLVPLRQRPGAYDALAEEAATRPLLSTPWHAEEYEAALARGDRFAADFHLRQLRATETAGAPGRFRRGLALLRGGHRTEGLADLVHPETPEDMHRDRVAWRALACLLRGDRSGYRAACTTRLILLGPDPSPREINDAVWLCCLGPDATSEPAAIVRLAEGLSAAGKPTERDAVGIVGGASAVGALAETWHYETLNTYGAALLRAGRAREAVRRLHQSRQMRGNIPAALDELLLALAHHRLGEERETRKWLNDAAQWIDRTRQPAAACGTVGAGPAGVLPAVVALLAERPDPRAAGSVENLRTWLEMDLLRGEAEAALAGGSSSH